MAHRKEIRLKNRALIALALGAVVSTMAPSGAGAVVVGKCGAVESVATLPSVRSGASENSDKVRVFKESSRTLSGALPVDIAFPGLYDTEASLPAPEPTINSGTAVESYFVHSDPVGQTADGAKRMPLALSFASDILGVMVRASTLSNSDAAVGAETTLYPNGNLERGLELAPKVDFVRVVNKRTIEVTVRTTSVVDQIRIITAPSPATVGGYRMVASDGGIFSFGDAGFHGSTGDIKLNQPIVGGAATCTGNGYWLVASDGGIFSFGDAEFHGSTGNKKLNQPIVGMAATPTGKGYWLVASDGGIFSFGDAAFHGSTGAIKLNKPIVGMTATPTGEGYWLVASDGGIFAFGDAGFHGSTGAINLNQPIVGMAATSTGQGYWLVASDGGIFSFGDAGFFGSTGDIKLNKPIVRML